MYVKGDTYVLVLYAITKATDLVWKRNDSVVSCFKSTKYMLKTDLNR